MHQQVTETSRAGSRFAALPDKKCRGNRHQFPEHVKGDEIAGKSHPQRTPRIDQRCHVLGIVLQVQCVDHPQQGHDRENVGEDQAQAVDAAENELLTQKLDHEPTAEEIARMVDKPVADVKRMLGLNERVASMDTPIGAGSDKSLLDTVADEGASDPADLLQDNDMSSCLEKWIDQLSDKQQEVLSRRFGLRGYPISTLEEVGHIFKVTRERVRQIEAKAVRKLQHPVRARKLEGFLEGAGER